MTALAGGDVYPLAVDAFLRGEIDAAVDPIWAQLVGPAFTFDPSHADESDLANLIGDPVAVAVDSVSDGTVFIDPIVFPAVPASDDQATAVVAYITGGPLLCRIYRRSDAVPMAITPDGGQITLTFARLLKL